jgi:hypothetical protein
MKIEEIFENILEENNVWVLGINVLAREIFGKAIDEDLEYQATKITKKRDYYEIYFLSGDVPLVFGYNIENVEAVINEDKIEMILIGDPEYKDLYIGIDETKEDYLKRFIIKWNMTLDEIKFYNQRKIKRQLLPIYINKVGNFRRSRF